MTKTLKSVGVVLIALAITLILTIKIIVALMYPVDIYGVLIYTIMLMVTICGMIELFEEGIV